MTAANEDAVDDSAVAIDAENARPRVAAARRWIERHYTRPLTIHRIARHVGLPTIRLEREFNALYGESPRMLLMRCRMQEADRLIEAGRTLTEVALLVGYSSERLFLRDHRRWSLRHKGAGETDHFK